MKVAVFSAKPYDRTFLEAACGDRHELHFFAPHLDETTVTLAVGFKAVCVFVNDTLSRPVLERLSAQGVRLIALRCAGFNNVDLPAANACGLQVARVPAYSPHAVAEHAVGLILALNRKLHRAYNRVREGNFSLDGLLGFDLHGRTVGLIGMGKIGSVVARIMQGFGCQVLVYDPYPAEEYRELGVSFVSLEQVLEESDIISLHCPLTPENHHLIGAESIARMKRGVMLINTSRGGLVDTRAVIKGLKEGQIGYLGLDVYEKEGDIFFEDLSGTIIRDDTFSRLLTFPNVMITGHQAFFTQEALENIAAITAENLDRFQAEGAPVHSVPTGNPRSSA